MNEIQARQVRVPTLPASKRAFALGRPILLGLAALALATMVGCNRSKSDAEPNVASAAAPESPAVAAATKYTCPMHPEVVSDKAAKCPKCGMNLVPAGEHQGHNQ